MNSSVTFRKKSKTKPGRKANPKLNSSFLFSVNKSITETFRPHLRKNYYPLNIIYVR